MKPTWKRLLKVAFSLVLLFLAGVGWQYWHVAQRGMQVRTFLDLQVLDARLQKAWEEGRLDQRGGEEILRAYGQDVYGNDFVFHYRPEGNDGRGSYVILSTGRDGSPDLDSLDAYFDAEPADVAGDYHRDNVRRGGQLIWHSGK